jgi:hypothetical protein
VVSHSNKFQKFRLWKENSIEDMVTLEGFTIQFKHDFLSYLGCLKN